MDEDSVKNKSINNVLFFTIGGSGIEHNSVVNHCNEVFDRKDDYLSSELKYILSHGYINGILELTLEYTKGWVSWHFLDLAECKESYTT